MFIRKIIEGTRVWSNLDEAAAAGGGGGTPPAETPAPENVETPPATPPAEEPKTPASIEDYNNAVEEEIDGEQESDEQDEDEGETPESDEAAGDEPAAVTFEDADTVETVLEKGKTLKEGYEFDAPVAAYIEKLEAAAQANTAANLPASIETVTEIVGAFDQMFDMIVDEETGESLPNTEPVVNLLRTKYANEFEPLAAAILASDSMKFAGSSMLEQFVVDGFGRDKAQNAFAYLHADIPLPTIPGGINLPDGISEDYKAAYSGLPESKRFEIEGLVADVQDLSERLKESNEYNREGIEIELTSKRNQLKGELLTIEKIQAGINAEAEQKIRSERQLIERQTAFNKKVITEYNTEIFGMADAFTKDLAPRLEFADAGAQMGLARDINTRIFNALAFQINADNSYAVDPMADYYANQLKEEGINFDWAKGRELLQKHHNATARLIALRETPGTSPQAIERAERAKNTLLNDIRANQTELLGQISTRYVKGVTKQTEAKIKEQQAKKIGARPRIQGNGAASGQKARPVAQDIAAYNAQRAKELKTGDDVFEHYTAG